MNNHLLLAYSWTFGHVGDVGITSGLLNLIGRQKPELPIQILAWQGADNAEFPRSQSYYPGYHANTQVHPNYFRELISDTAAKDGAWQKFVERWGARKIKNFELGCFSAYEAEALAEDLLERFPLELHAEIQRLKPEAADLFLRAGFVLFNCSTSLSFGRLGVRKLWSNTLRNVMPLLIARALKVPYGLNPQSMEAVDWPLDLVYRRLFADAQFLYCRDSDSLAYLEQRNLLNKNSGFRPDTTFFFNCPDIVWSERFLRENDLNNGEFAVFMVRIPVSKPGTEDPVAGAVSAERLAALMEKNRYVIEQWVERTGLKILICHEGADTVPSAREHLWRLLSSATKARCVYMDHFWTTEQALGVYAQARLMISMEIHSAFLALGAGTPVVHHPFVEAGRKMEVFRDLGLGDWLVDIDEGSAEEILAPALHIHEDYAAAKGRIQALLSGWEAKANATLHEIWTNWRT